MSSIAQSDPIEIPIEPCFLCLNGCDLPEALQCQIREERRLRDGLRLATDMFDAEVLAFDLRAAERQVDALLAMAREARP